jgi:adenylate cyclase
MTTAYDAQSAAPLFDDVADWLMERALSETSVEALAEGCFLRLHAAGIPLTRAQASFRVLHPLYTATSITWTPASGVTTEHFRRTGSDPARSAGGYDASPIAYMVKTGMPFMRRRLTGPDAVLDFPILTGFLDGGGTDYLAYLVMFDPRRQMGVFGSWLTDRPNGFSETDVRGLKRIQHQFAVALKLSIKDQIAQNALRTYLGADAGAQVLDGRITLGDVQTIDAAVWYSDLRNSTQLADTMKPDDFLALLNRYFDVSAGSVIEAGGQVLLLIGDAVLAIFPIGEGKFSAEAACLAAASAAAKARERVAAMARESPVPAVGFEFGIGLHLGQLQFGNIGVPERLQFTVVGPAANEVARLEGLTKTLGTQVLASRAFVDRLGATWSSLGERTLTGRKDPVEVFTPPH